MAVVAILSKVMEGIRNKGTEGILSKVMAGIRNRAMQGILNSK